MGVKAILSLPFLVSLTLSVSANDRDVRKLTEGVTQIGKPGVPGPLCSFGEKSFPVILGKSGQVRHPLVVAARFGRGRVVAFGHGGYLTARSHNAAPLLVNGVRWCRPGRKNIVVGVYKNGGLAEMFRGEGWTVQESPLENLDSLHVLVMDAHFLKSEDHRAAVSRFIQKGGGLITAGLGWGWNQLNPGKEHPGNLLLAEAGIVWADGYLDVTGKKGFDVGTIPDPMTQATRALAAFASGKTMSKVDRAQAMETLSLALRSIPGEDRLLRRHLRSLLKSQGNSTVPTKKNRIGINQPLARLSLTLDIIRTKQLPPDEVRAHPAAEAFPGNVPRAAKRVTGTVSVDTSIPGWHSTGFYAAPGEKITVSISGGLTREKLSVRIGSHKDKLWKKDSWWRAPEISRRFNLKTESTDAANAFGGLVYVDVPRKCTAGKIRVTIRGAVEAPLYIHGVTDLEEWKKTLRHHPGPWAEIGSRKMIVTVPSRVIRELDSPDKVAKAWERIIDLDAELAGVSSAKSRPERIVSDVQISAGYMHSGYPIMVHRDQDRNLVDVDHLRKGNWGLFHELGHNHQGGGWTFGGTTEVTCNLFSLYVYEKFCDQPVATHKRGSKEFRRNKMSKMNFDKPEFGKWKSDPFLALVMYLQIQQEFGWEPFRRVFREYLALPKQDRPKNDAEKRDQWMVRMSRQVGRNLGPFFQLWGLSTSEKARKSIEGLPPWISTDFPDQP